MDLSSPKRGWAGRGRTSSEAMSAAGNKLLKAVLALADRLDCGDKECPADATCVTSIAMNEVITMRKRGGTYFCKFEGGARISCRCAGGPPPPSPKLG